jgi:PIN domain nuclease of toxin-antitoxin system
VRLLLDTHVFLWAASNPSKLSDVALDAITDCANDVCVSAAAGWEIAIKFSRGQLPLPMHPALYVPARIAALRFAALPVTMEHALSVASLEQRHRDPFDRIMIAQAQFEAMTLVTRDPIVRQYAVSTLEA